MQKLRNSTQLLLVSVVGMLVLAACTLQIDPSMASTGEETGEPPAESGGLIAVPPVDIG